MKQEILRKRAELDAQNAQARQQRNSPQHRAAQAAPPAPAHPPIEKVTDPSNLPALWHATRTFLSQNARLLESVLGPCSSLTAFNAETREVTLTVPAAHKNFTNDKAKSKLEEALRAISSPTLRLVVDFDETTPLPPPPSNPNAAGPSHAAARIPPELLDAVKSQPVILRLAKMLDATITQVEIMDATDPESAPEP